MLSKMIVSMVTLLLSAGVFASVELSARTGNTECVIKNNEVTRKVFFGKDKILKLTQKSSFEFEGIDQTAVAAAEVASQSEASGSPFEMVLEGKTYSLISGESIPALKLIQMMVSVCQLR